MAEFWNALTLVQKIFYFIAVPSTAVLIFQTILTVIGIGGGADGDADADFDGDFDADGIDGEFDGDGLDDFDPDADLDDFNAAGFRLFTIKGIVAFFAIFGWTGIVILAKGGAVLTASLVSLLAGTAALFGVAGALYGFSKLQADGTLNIRTAVGRTATVYIPIAADRKPGGKVQLILQDQLRELPAVTGGDTPIPTGTTVEIVAVDANETLIVVPLTVKTPTAI